MFCVGQGVLGKIRFVDGSLPPYDRTYLIISVSNDYIEIVNISSTKGKEHKLLFPTNEGLKTYNPPFEKPSFAKLDSRVRVQKADWGQLKILHNGATLDQEELERIIPLIMH